MWLCLNECEYLLWSSTIFDVRTRLMSAPTGWKAAFGYGLLQYLPTLSQHIRCREEGGRQRDLSSLSAQGTYRFRHRPGNGFRAARQCNQRISGGCQALLQDSSICIIVVYIYIYVCVCVCVCIYICVRVWEFYYHYYCYCFDAYVYIYMYIRVCVCVFVAASIQTGQDP